jgi:hypothetical protein
MASEPACNNHLSSQLGRLLSEIIGFPAMSLNRVCVNFEYIEAGISLNYLVNWKVAPLL